MNATKVTIQETGGNCAEFKKQVIAHYAGDNTLHSDTAKAHQLYQSSIMSALVHGVFEGDLTFEELARHGDFGLGTFNNLDGEMVALDGKFFQLRSDGSATPVHPDQKTPFATVNFFREDANFDISQPIDKKGLQAFINQAIDSLNLFFAIRVDGVFAKVVTRTVSLQHRPFKPLTEVTGEQAVFHFESVSGTLAGYRSPDYAQGLAVAGYHLHFITADRTGGGHVLDFQLTKGRVKIDPYSSLFVSLPETVEFETARLSLDGDAIQEAEG
jgi:acetolactate decarboxylase